MLVFNRRSTEGLRLLNTNENYTSNYISVPDICLAEEKLCWLRVIFFFGTTFGLPSPPTKTYWAKERPFSYTQGAINQPTMEQRSRTIREPEAADDDDETMLVGGQELEDQTFPRILYCMLSSDESNLGKNFPAFRFWDGGHLANSKL